MLDDLRMRNDPNSRAAFDALINSQASRLTLFLQSMKIGEGHVSNHGRRPVYNVDLVNAFSMMDWPAGEPVRPQEAQLLESVFSQYYLLVVP